MKLTQMIKWKFLKKVEDKFERNEIHLFFNGNILEDNEPISSYDIEENNTISFIGNFRAGMLYFEI